MSWGQVKTKAKDGVTGIAELRYLITWSQLELHMSTLYNLNTIAAYSVNGQATVASVSYTHLTLPTIYSV